MKQYLAKNLHVDGNNVTLDIVGKGTLTADLSLWDEIIISIGGKSNIQKVKLLGDLLEFPNNVHIEIEDFISLAEQQKKLPVAGFTQEIHRHYQT